MAQTKTHYINGFKIRKVCLGGYRMNFNPYGTNPFTPVVKYWIISYKRKIIDTALTFNRARQKVSSKRNVSYMKVSS